MAGVAPDPRPGRSHRRASSSRISCGSPATGRAGSALAADPDNTGYGHSWHEVMSIRPESAEALIEYYEAVLARTRELLDRTTAADLDRIVDERWNPPVTLGVRLVSIADDDIQHAGAEPSYVAGIRDQMACSVGFRR